LNFATSEGRAVLTLNRRHFIRLHRENGQHAGIIVCTVDADFIAQAERIHVAITERRSLKEELIRVNRHSP